MISIMCAIFAWLSVWDYPSRQSTHVKLREDFIEAIRMGDTSSMRSICEKAVSVFPEDPTWHYNLACALAYQKNPDSAFNMLERSIDLGFRDVAAIKRDQDLKRLSNNPRYLELIRYAEKKRNSPILSGPLATVPAYGIFGSDVILGEQNVAWDFDAGCFRALMSMSNVSIPESQRELYMNLDDKHSNLVVTNYPGLSSVHLDSEAKKRGYHLNFPMFSFPYPLFGNASRAFVNGPYWRSIPRAFMTTESKRLGLMTRFYLSNQVWVFPVNADCPPVGTNGDVFASSAPYWIQTAGKSWSDQYYLRAALLASRSLAPAVKSAVVGRGLLAPTIQMLIRRSLKGVESEDEYLSPKAHPTAMPPNGLNLEKLEAIAGALKLDEIPPVVAIKVSGDESQIQKKGPGELTYASSCSWAFVLRSPIEKRIFYIQAHGADSYEFRRVHGDEKSVVIEKLKSDVAKITVDRNRINPTNRLDIAVFGKIANSQWSAPSFVSFAVMEGGEGYSDPVLSWSDSSE